MQRCVGVRLNNGSHNPKQYDCAFEGDPPPVGRWVVVRTPRGLELGKVRSEPREVDKPYGEVVRLARADDHERAVVLKERAEELKWWLKARMRREGMGVKVLGCTYTLDGGHVVVRYAAEARVDLRRFVGEIARRAGARVEFAAMGPRDQTAYLGTLGACGMESCCSTWLQEFAPVTIRMARDQQLPLNPEKISGPCGRLLCCLQYEHAMYKELLADLPKKNARVCSKDGVCGKVQKLNPLAGTVDVLTQEGAVVTVPKEELQRE